jgi:hypothetical protein
MRGERTKWEQDQVNQAAAMAMAATWRLEEQLVYRACPPGLYVDEAHYARVLALNDGTPRSNLARDRGAVSALRASGMDPDQMAAALRWPAARVARALGPMPWWAAGVARLRAIAEQRAAILARPPLVSPPMELGPEIPVVSGPAGGVRTPPPIAPGANIWGTPASWAR